MVAATRFMLSSETASSMPWMLRATGPYTVTGMSVINAKWRPSVVAVWKANGQIGV